MSIEKQSKATKKKQSKTTKKQSKTTKKQSKTTGIVNIDKNTKKYIKKVNDIYIKLKKEILKEWNNKKKKCSNNLIPLIHRENIVLLTHIIEKNLLKLKKDVKMTEYFKILLRLLDKKTKSIPGLQFKRILIDSLLKDNYNFGIKEIKSLARKVGLKIKQNNNNIKILDKLDEGCFGESFLVKYKGKECVMKTQIINNFYENINYSIAEIERIANEINIQNRLKNLNVTPNIYDYYIIMDDYGFLEINIIMEYCGISLEKWLNYNKLNKSDIQQLKKKLEIIHSHNIWHYDIYSDNILVKEYDNKTDFFYIDFGISSGIKESEYKNTNMLKKIIKSKEYINKNIIYDILIEFGIFC